MATGRLPDPNSSPLTAKGDLYTYSTVPAKLAVGNNGETLVADSSASTGLRWQGNFAAGKNAIINGDFNINQRNLTSTTSSGSYGHDRWVFNYTNGTVTYSNQSFTPGTAPVAGYEAKQFARLVTSGQSATNANTLLDQRIESVRTFAGQTITISFWAKAGTGTPSVSMELNQGFGTGGSPSADVNTYVGKTAITTSWARYSFTIAVPSITGKTLGTNNNDNLNVRFWLSAGSDFNSRSGSLGIQNNTIDIWGVQVEAGNVATAFQTATGTLAGELAACEYYYQRFVRTNNVGLAQCIGTSLADGMLQLKRTMRVAPTITLAAAGSGTGQLAFLTSNGNYPTTIGTNSANYITTDGFNIAGSGYTGAFTTGNATTFWITGTNQTAYTASAEL